MGGTLVGNSKLSCSENRIIHDKQIYQIDWQIYNAIVSIYHNLNFIGQNYLRWLMYTTMGISLIINRIIIWITKD